jgi:tRNA(fMet)-specific endonuclease VapC
MSLYVLDTDILTLDRQGHALVHQRISSHPPAELAITVISVEEVLSGWYTLLRRARQPPQLARGYRELIDSIEYLSRWHILAFPEPAIARYDQLQAAKIQVRRMDLRIAAITLENGGILVTRNLRDFQRVPGLVVENWAV